MLIGRITLIPIDAQISLNLIGDSMFIDDEILAMEGILKFALLVVFNNFSWVLRMVVDCTDFHMHLEFAYLALA